MFRVKPGEIKDLSSNPPAQVHKYKTAAVPGSSTEDKMCQSSGVPLLLPPRISGSGRLRVPPCSCRAEDGASAVGLGCLRASGCDSRGWQPLHTPPVLQRGWSRDTLGSTLCAQEKGAALWGLNSPGKGGMQALLPRLPLSSWDSWLLLLQLQLQNGFS